MNFYPPDIISLVWMKTQPITITSTIEPTTNNSRMKSCCADSIPKSTHANSKSKNLKSTPTNYKVEFLLGIPNRNCSRLIPSWNLLLN